MKVEFTRTWAMPNRWTFRIAPIKQLIHRYVGDGKGWIDPFAGENSPAEITNDLNPIRPTIYHLHALDFANVLVGEFKGVLFDPPYSLRQTKECYDGIGYEMTQTDTQSFPNNVKKALADKVAPGGYVITFGWNSTGFGKDLGFKIVEIMLVAHGGHHNDTIITVEKKINSQIKLF